VLGSHWNGAKGCPIPAANGVLVDNICGFTLFFHFISLSFI
jgi:hypothetical protein